MNNSLAPYLSFNGNCREAMNFYKDTFDGELELTTWADAPPDTCGGEDSKEKMKDKVIHSCLNTEDFCLMGADIPNGDPNFGDNVQLAITCQKKPRAYLKH